jgi:preprotein translocase subunit SecG
MSFLIGFLTFILIVNCLLLILLVLIQLPKKDAGAGLAFGGSATDALFGAGSGNVLTKVTKYATVAFFILAMVLSLLQSRYYHGSTLALQRLIDQQNQQPAGLPAPSATPGATPAASVLTNLPASAPAATAPNSQPAAGLITTNLPATPGPAGVPAPQK